LKVPVYLPSELWQSRSQQIEAKVISVSVKPGDNVKIGDVIAEVEVDKAILAIESHVEGVVVEVHVAPGDTVRPGDPLITVEVPDS
jgi:pyruvate/2-oxoglutarate dehydrogenase complex dihydrolipoamide acyltransferase (E2) component